MAMADEKPTVKLLAVLADHEVESDFRFLVDEKLVKYVKIDHGVYDIDDMCFAPVLIPILPPFPRGDWNTGRISKDPSNDRPYFSETKKVSLPAVTHIWHPLKIDFLDLTWGKRLFASVYEVTCPQFDSTVVVKFAQFPWEVGYHDAETRAYEWLADHDIGPKFLGHLTEEGRVIGFFIEKVEDFRHAGPEDLLLCQKALKKLHDLGIKHGDTNKHNFLICGDRATLIDFEAAHHCDDPKLLEEEMNGLVGQLADQSGRGGRMPLT